VNLDGLLDNKYLLADKAGTIRARLRVSTNELAAVIRPRINLALVMDTSGSMEGDAMQHAIEAGVALVDALQPGDRLAVVSFGSRAELIVPSTVLDAKSTELVREKIRGMSASGTTDMAAGLSMGIDQVRSWLDPQGINRIVLLGDGVPNDEAPIIPLAENAGAMGIAITSLGLGVDFNETLMLAVAHRSGGRYHYIDEPAKVAEMFVNEVLRLNRVIARGLTLSLRGGPGVTIAKVFGRADVAPGVAVSLGGLGDLAEGETRDVIVELKAPARKDGAPVEVLDAWLGFEDAVGGSGRQERHVYLAMRATKDEAKVKENVNLEVLRAAADQSLAADTVQAIALARGRQLQQALALVDSAEKEARRAARELDYPALAKAADELKPLRASLPSMVPPEVVEIVKEQIEITPEYEIPATTSAPEVIREHHDRAVQAIEPH
jgi:Ca-activated chloride channel family protein